MFVVQLLLSHFILKRCGGQSGLVAEVGLCRLVVAKADDRMCQAYNDITSQARIRLFLEVPL